MKKSWQIFWHILFWVSIIAFILFIADSNAKLSASDQVVIVIFFIADITLFYLNYLALMPQFLNRKRYGVYAASLVLTLIFFGLLKYGLACIFKGQVLVRPKMPRIGFWAFFLSTTISNMVFLFLSAVFKFTADWFINERIQRDLENQRLSAELAFLKSQINPHFLFNSLNSIYSLAYQRSETTPEAILKLSEIMRYMLYECNDNKVDLAKELQYLQNYIDLQKIRFANKAYIDFKIEGKVESQQIVPLLLIAFIENAFKHGAANNPLTPIRLLIDVDEAYLHFFIQNKKHTNNRDASGGIGLNNVKRRLDLLYPGKYNLDIKDETDTYTVELSLVL
jgi:two-component sensor histidine kinase